MKNSPSASTTFLVSLLIISFTYLLSAQNRTCYPKDQIAINKIQTAFGVTPTPNCCDWVDAVTCDEVAPFRVIYIRIFDSNISGQIPAAIGDLSALAIFELVNVPNITGNIPPAITKLTNLDLLIVSHASLSGPIPTFLVNLKNLTWLDLSFNALTGPIPPQLSQFPNIQVFYLDGNKLTGTIPESFGHFAKSLEFLTLSGNFLTGTIPKSLGNLNVINIDLSGNNLTGDASFLFGKNKRTHDVILHTNNLTFDLSKVEFPTNLTVLKLSHNNIFGSLPQELTKFDLVMFNVSYNNLCGEIPQGGTFSPLELILIFTISVYVVLLCHFVSEYVKKLRLPWLSTNSQDVLFH